jgi:hypothetical protein
MSTSVLSLSTLARGCSVVPARPSMHSEKHDQTYPMFEWGLNWCIASHAHSFLVIHATVVERGGRAMVLPAPPGSGKAPCVPDW